MSWSRRKKTGLWEWGCLNSQKLSRGGRLSVMNDLVLKERRGAIVILTLNRPEKLNALNYQLIDRLLQLLDLIEDDPSLRAVIVTGAGDRAFSAGADIAEFSGSMKAGPDVALKAF